MPGLTSRPGRRSSVAETPSPSAEQALEEAGLKIVERVSIQVDSAESATKYLRTKKEKLGHLLDFNVS